MDSATQDIYYQKINELLLDEEKVITCVSLADALKLNVNDAKSLLSTFVKDFRQQKPKDLELTYIVTGSLKDGKGLAVQMIKEEDLNERKKNFETIYTELIYSIQKNKIVDFNVITLIDKNILEGSHNVGGLIVPENCGKREIKKKVPQPTQTESVKEKDSFFKKVQTSNSTNGSITQSGSSSQEKHIKSKQSGSIANFFTKASQKTNGNSQPDKEKAQPKEELFTETKKPEEKIQPKEDLLPKIENSKINIKQEPIVNGKDENKMEKCVQKMEVDNDKTSIEQPQQKVNSKKRKKNVKSENTSNKKRKRIQEICDSDSSDIFEDEKDEDIIERSDEEPEPVPVIKPVLESDGSNKCKRRKAVDEVYMDDEGFMVTTTKYVYVSEDDDEEKQPVKSVEEKPKVLVEKKNSTTDSENDGKKSKPSKGKAKNKKAASGTQTTLMNFFKKN